MRSVSWGLVACFALAAQSAAQDAAGAPYPRPAGAHEVSIERSVMVPMRDGVKLATDVYRPADVAGALPTILIRTPYNKGANPRGDGSANFFSSHGYAVVVQDVRGKFASEGQFRVYEGDKTDWSDMFDWIGAQPWSTGRIGTYGCSYLGEGQIIAAQQRHPRHIAAIAQAAGGNVGRIGRRRQFWGSVEGGAFSISINFGWMPVFASLDKGARPMPNVDLASFFRTLPVLDMTDRAGSPSWDWRNFLERSPDDPWWDRHGYLTARDSVSVAALHVSSWFDLAAEALEEAELFRKNALNERARTGQYAIISPTTHCLSERASNQTKVGDLPVGDARLHYFETYLAWFDRWLRGNERALDSLPRIQYYVIGRNQWRTSDRWPVRGMRETAFYLRSDGGANSSRGNGRLSLAAPTRERADTFTYDPANPVPARGGSICCTGNPKDVPGSFDNADIEQRPDVLVYTGDVLREGLELTGPMRAVAYLSSDARDTDLTVKLLDVFPDGRSMNMQEGITRVRYRDGFDKARMMEPGKVYEVPVDLHATSWYLPAGHRLRVEISSSNFPRFDRNLNTGGHNYDETTWRSAKNAVHHSALQASRLILPVVR
ncbi:MAG TPA: CocE/NonD family hydrolase [Gemmatimonadaceae bacterium]|nr:CocE/NonD family hydrolase [Gemmatimonadaceae bacterium]